MTIQPAGVTDGCANPIIGGGGSLVYPAIKSPDFSIPGQTGWAIMKNGNAYFYNVIAEGTITASTFLGTDFIINASGAFFYSAAPAAGNLAAAIAGVAGTDSFGNAYPQGVTVFLPVSAGSFSGTYAIQLGNFTNAGGAGSGNAALTLGNVTSPPHLPPGVISQNDSSQSSCTLNSGNATSGAANSQVTVFDSTYSPGGLIQLAAGKAQFASALDNNNYDLGQIALTVSANTNITATSAVSLPWDQGTNGLTIAPGVKYLVRAVLRAQQITAAVADNFSVTITGATVSASSLVWNFMMTGAGGGLDNTSATLVPSGTVGSPAYAASDVYAVYIDGFFTVSGSSNGRFNINGWRSVAGDQWNIVAGSYVLLMPIT